MSIATELGKLNTQRENLAANLTTKGVTASSSETLAQLVPKVLDIAGGGGGGGFTYGFNLKAYDGMTLSSIVKP